MSRHARPHNRLPRLPPAHVPRPRLSRALLTNDCRLTLLCAPAGFGKSVLLNECARQAPADTRMLWLDLGGRTLSPADLLGRLAAALDLTPGPGEPEDELWRLLDRFAQPLWIMLDDYPRQPSVALDDCLGRLLEQTPPTLRWWIGGRRRPAWSLPRLLLQGELQELDAQALALNAAELQQLLAAQGLELPTELGERLLHDYEGWPAGIGLLLLKADPALLRERLVAGTPLLREYIAREVLGGLPPPLSRALLVLAHLLRFSAALCEQLLEVDSSELLDELRNRQLVVSHGLERSSEWFRLSRPLAQSLKRLPGGLPLPQLHQRASQWFFQHGLMREAVEHALWAEQPELAASYLQRFGQEQLLVEQSGTQFLQWRSELPSTLFTSTPRVITLLGWALLLCARLDQVEACMADLARFLPQADVHRQRQLLAQWQAVIGVQQRQLGRRSARQHCLEALEVLSETAWSQRVLCYQALAQQALALGELDEARRCGDAGLKLARLKGSLVFEGLLNVDQLHLLAMCGEFERGVELADKALQQVSTAQRHGPVLARLRLLHGSLLASQGRTEEAYAAYRVGLQEAEVCEDAYLLFGYLGLAELAADAGDHAQALQLLREAERQMQLLQVSEERYRGVLQLADGALCLRRGDWQAAREILQPLFEHYQRQELLPPSGFYDLLPRLRHYLVLADLRAGLLAPALAALHVLHAECREQGLLALACECRFSLVEALLAEGNQAAAEHELRGALAEAQSMQLVRPLLEFHARQPELLQQHVGEGQRQYLQQRPVPDAEQGKDKASPLTARELEVLQLIAQGRSNQEIAELMFISLHTVKTHARRINGKLKVERRTQALVQAKALGLLD
ncbi:LuxR C-terminal-related transcriptional regulator [Pseudomonas sp. LS44]|uniref:LuxR C-terminal-related transcriptional regulator n=1 Tax=Pseudomonas sp. LS44 TaxID=1357074 RepID=UPI00215A8F84|nr:LuxR C-terminal-related transcriptional regulator [Pseudomonas sp. LS44]UVE18340.1 LuxR C-terminal-related transcriptional regulator [Pseudomonas sp. LS44]